MALRQRCAAFGNLVGFVQKAGADLCVLQTCGVLRNSNRLHAQFLKSVSTVCEASLHLLPRADLFHSDSDDVIVLTLRSLSTTF